MFDFTNEANIGKDYNGFILLSIDDLPEHNAKGVFLRHKRTGLEVYHMVKDDKENLFAFAFRTISKDSKGTAHIMEHSTLCGSEKYPLKEPFTTLTSQSLNTFLNALTFPDKTVYPGASLVKNDYFNMMDVYADSVFFPKLDYNTFIQEGHRLELDENGKYSIQGVVYNEMKGEYSSFSQIAFSDQIAVMYPDSYPAFDSGGDPLYIPELTYEQFLDFHQKFYNPDNCLLFLYGDIPTSEQLDYLNEHFMARIEKKYNCVKDVPYFDSKLPYVKPEIKELQKLNLHTKSASFKTYAPETGATGSMVGLSWYSGKANMEKLFLTEILCGNDTSPVSRALKDSGLGDEDFGGNFGQFDEEFFNFCLNGVKKGDEEKVFQVITTCLQELYENGVKQEDIDSAVMGLDFTLREVNRYFGPNSISIMQKAMKGWTSGKPCCSQISPIAAFEKVKADLRADKDFVKKLLEKYFIKNDVKIKFVCEPSPAYFKKREEAENTLIEKLSAQVNNEELKKSLEELHQYQQKIETPEESACIPHTKVSELDSDVPMTKVELHFAEGSDGSKVPLFVNQEETNGIFYMDVLFPYDTIEPKYYKYLSFLSDVVTNLGWDGKPWDQCVAESACIMGDVWGKIVNTSLQNEVEAVEFAKKYEEYNFCGRRWFGLGCKALTEQAAPTLEMLAKIITKMDFEDEAHYLQILQEMKAEKKSNLISSGRELAMRRARVPFSKDYAISEILFGVTQLYAVAELNKKNAKKTLGIFKMLYNEIRQAGGIVHITADKASLEKMLPLVEEFVKTAEITKLMPAGKYSMGDILPYVVEAENVMGKNFTEIIKADSPTGYGVTATTASDFMNKDSAAEYIFASWFSMHTLWDKIRTTGGAYGAHSNIGQDRVFLQASYRDPSPEKSVEVFETSLKEASNFIIPHEDIERTKVSIFGDIITPLSPKEQGASAFEGFLSGSYGLKKKRIEYILNATDESIHEAAVRLGKNIHKTSRKVVFGNNSIECAGKILKLPL